MRIARYVTITATLLLAACSSSDLQRERMRTLEAKPNFKSDTSSPGYISQALVVGDTQIHWPSDAPDPTALAKDRTYSIDTLETNLIDTKFWWSEMIRLRDGDQLLYDASICDLHKVQMKREPVEVTYGLLDFRSPYWKAMATDFPNIDHVSGGCVVDSMGPIRRTWICPKCMANQQHWVSDQKMIAP